MLHSHALISSLLLEAWFIDQAYAEVMLPSVIEMLEGKNTINVNVKDYEKPIPSLIDSDHRAISLSTGAGEPFAGFGSAPSGSTAIIPIRGAITKYDGYCNYGVETYMQWVEAAEQSPSVSDICLLIDSPGGQANSAFMFAQRVADIKKPTLAYVDSGMAASAAYLLASACDMIKVSTPVDMLGSIGAMISFSDYSSRFEGTKTWEIYSRLSSEKNNAFRRLRENNDASLIQDMLDENVNHFIAAVKTNRGDRLNLSVADPFKGATYTAAQALKIGLIDGIEPLPQALAALRTSKPAKRSVSTQLATETVTESPETETIEPEMETIEAEIETITPENQPDQPNTTMNWKQSLAKWLNDQPEETTPEAAAEVPELTMEQRLAALETAHQTQISNLTAENQRLQAALNGKPAAEPTAVIVASEKVPTPVEIPEDTTSLLCETDLIANQLRASRVK